MNSILGFAAHYSGVENLLMDLDLLGGLSKNELGIFGLWMFIGKLSPETHLGLYRHQRFKHRFSLKTINYYVTLRI
jgi:hypothetical protein